MGAGKGKGKRVHALVSPTAGSGTSVRGGVGTYMDKWRDFVNSSGLRDIKLHEYYLNGKNPYDYTRADEVKLTMEVFADMVAVGAIILSQPYSVDDFEFVVTS